MLITKDNVADVMTSALQELDVRGLDLLSLDIDGNEYYVMESIFKVVSPGSLRFEYNAKFPYPMRVTIDYDAGHVWRQDDYHGASLGSLVELFERFGYRLLTCGSAWVNAFFLRADEEAHFTIYDPAVLYQPARFYLQHALHGHAPSLGFLRSQVGKRADGSAPPTAHG